MKEAMNFYRKNSRQCPEKEGLSQKGQSEPSENLIIRLHSLGHVCQEVAGGHEGLHIALLTL